MSNYKSYSSSRPSRNSTKFSRRFNGGGSGSRPKANRFAGQYINPERFVQPARPVEEATYTARHSFQDFAVNQLLKDNLAAKGFSTPTPIQDQTIPAALAGKDVIGLADTGTGKTAAFALPTINNMMNDRSSHTLIIAPTRELAQQIEMECRSIAKGSGIRGTLLIGGAPMGPQLRDLRARPQVVIGTPGRIKDHLERGTLKLSHFKNVVLDEVDRMLDMGFLPDVREILSNLPSERQSYFFSATLDAKVRELINTFAKDPVTVSVKSGNTSEHIDQNIVRYVSVSEKVDKLHDVLIKEEVEKVIVFDSTQRSVERLSQELQTRGFRADAIHGGKSQGQRQRALQRFKDNQINVLVATDVAARGIDVADITHVINYSTPQSYNDYIHRIGRAGRAGRVGYALTFVTS